LTPILETLRDRTAAAAPECVPADGAAWPLALRGARLAPDPARDAASASWGDYAPEFEVISYASLDLVIPEDTWGYVGRSHSLWYCDAVERGTFGWYETAFMIRPMMGRKTTGEPVAREPGEDAGGAVSRVMTVWQVAWPFMPVDPSNMDEFIERWLGWFADAAQGELRRPSQMPERDTTGTYRLEGEERAPQPWSA
jgi:serine/threonine-protein kinase